MEFLEIPCLYLYSCLFINQWLQKKKSEMRELNWVLPVSDKFSLHTQKSHNWIQVNFPFGQVKGEPANQIMI